MNIVVICCSMFFVVSVIFIVYIIKLKKDNKMLNQKLKNCISSSTMKNNSILDVNECIFMLAEDLKSITNKTSKKMNKELNNISSILFQLNNDIAVVIDNDLINERNISVVNIKKEIAEIVTSINEVCSSTIVFDCDSSIKTSFAFDNIKLCSIIKNIISLSLTNRNNSNKIKINLKLVENNYSLSKINIEFQNIKLVKDDMLNATIFDFFNINDLDTKLLDSYTYNNPRLLIIRENLRSMNANVNFKNCGLDMSIELFLKRKKSDYDKIKALIVDDNENIAKYNQEILKSINVDSDIVSSGNECLKKLKSSYGEYNIIFTDNQMPEMDGVDLLRKIREIPDFILPVIVVTADDDREFFIDMCGFNDYVKKPLNQKDVTKIIEKYVINKKQ